MVTARIASAFLLALALAGVVAQSGISGATVNEAGAPAVAYGNVTDEFIWHTLKP
ncbi:MULTISPECIES: hypothetical protein [unclassified Streptomyces]|uniref:hypothetical protein n=1 Tax=unclassified Streptomyces TaxID=2593676 RepID=UPI0035D81506